MLESGLIFHTFHLTAWVMFIATTSNVHDGMLLYTVHRCLLYAASNYKMTTYIDNEENCSNQQGTCCTVFPEYPIYRNIGRYKDRRSARMNPKGYNRTLKQRKISYFNSLLGSNHFQWQRVKKMFFVCSRCRSETYIWLFRVYVLRIVVLQITATKMLAARAV